MPYKSSSTDILLTCTQCGTPFPISRANRRRGRGTYCGRACYAEARTVPVEERIWPKVTKTETCWEWTGAHTQEGQGQIRVSGATKLVTRIVWELTNGPIPPGLFVCHHCDNPSCVRPDHLFLGTQTDNMQDAVAKGRVRNGAETHPESFRKGEHHGMAKLTEDQAKAILERSAAGETRRSLAREFNVSTWTIRQIALGHLWKHLDHPRYPSKYDPKHLRIKY